MKILKLPPVEYLRECFAYDRQTGKLFWRKRPRKHFSRNKDFLRWNGLFAGAEACSARMKSGHIRLTLDKRQYLAHRVIWKLVTGKDPKRLIDHEDRKGQQSLE